MAKTAAAMTVTKDKAIALLKALKMPTVKESWDKERLTSKISTIQTMPDARKVKIADKELQRLLLSILDAFEDDKEVTVIDPPKGKKPARAAEPDEEDDDDEEEEVEDDDSEEEGEEEESEEVDEDEEEEEESEEDDEPPAKKGKGKIAAKAKPSKNGKPGKKAKAAAGAGWGGATTGEAFVRKFPKPKDGRSVREILWELYKKTKGKVSVNDAYEKVKKYAKKSTVNIWLWKFKKEGASAAGKAGKK